MKLKPFGFAEHMLYYDFDFMIGHLESMANFEEETLSGLPGRKQVRYDKVMDAIQLLQEASEM